MDIAKLYTPCSRCDGTGEARSGEVGETCYNCGGTGFQESMSHIDVTDLVEKLDLLIEGVTAIWNKVK